MQVGDVGGDDADGATALLLERVDADPGGVVGGAAAGQHQVPRRRGRPGIRPSQADGAGPPVTR